MFAFFIIFPSQTDVPDVEIPDVSGLSVLDAEAKLMAAGLTVATEVYETPSDTVAKDMIVKTSPIIGRTVKKKSVITLYKSSGTS